MGCSHFTCRPFDCLSRQQHLGKGTNRRISLVEHYPKTAVSCGKTSHQMLLEHMKDVNPVPSLHSVRTFGEPGYVHTPVQKRVQSAELQPRASKMYFVGREGSRIYHMWDSVTGKVHRSSSATWAKHGLVKPPQALSNELPQIISNKIPHTQRHSIPLFEPALQFPPSSPYTPTDQESGGGSAQQPGGEIIEDEIQLPELDSGFEFNRLWQPVLCQWNVWASADSLDIKSSAYLVDEAVLNEPSLVQH
jgi:hypothetical protein